MVVPRQHAPRPVARYRRRDRLMSHPTAVSTKNGQLVRGLRAARANERRCRKRASVFNIGCISVVYSIVPSRDLQAHLTKQRRYR